MIHRHRSRPLCAGRRAAVSALAAVVACYGTTGGRTATAAITSAGDVSPVPPAAGGAVVGPLRVGNVDVGTMSITGGTPLASTNAAILGDSVTGIGIVNMSGFGSDWTLTTAGADFTLGNNGAGSLNLSSLAFLSINDDFFAAAQLNSQAQMNISGLGTIVDVGDDANIAQRGQALINITNGGRLVTDQNIIGDEAAGDGRVLVRDPLSLWRTTNTMTIADAGRGRLEILDGARVQNTGGVVAQQAGSSGSVEVRGAGSLWDNSFNLIIGEFGHGTLTVADGGRVVNGLGANSMIIGRQRGSVGRVEVRGAESLLSVSLLDVGDSGDGTLNVLEGGRVQSGISIIGDNATARGEVLVDGPGSRWDASGAIDIGDFGEARLTVSAGGVVHTSSIMRVGAVGRLSLEGGRVEIETTPVALTNAGVIDGNGTIEALTTNNNASGQIRPTGAAPLLFTGTLSNFGLIDVASGVLEVRGPTGNNQSIDARNGSILRFRGTGLDNNSGSRLAITSGAVDVFGLVNNDAGAEIVVGGAANAVFHDAVTNNGTLFVQPGGRVLMLENLGFAPSSILSLPLTSAQGPGQVHVAGAATVAGSLEIPTGGGFAPLPGDRFTVLTSAAVSGTFGSATIPAAGGIQFHPIYSPTNVSVLVARAGDKTWGIDASGNASAGANWLGGVAPGAVDDRAAFTTIINANRTVTVDAPMTAGSLYFDDNDSYTLAGPGTVTLDVSSGSARIDVKNLHGNGTHTVAAPLVLRDNTVVDVASSSTLRLLGPVSGAAGVSLTKSGAGTLAVRHVRNAALRVDAGAVRVLPGGGDAGTSLLDSLTFAGSQGSWDGLLDLTDNGMVIRAADLSVLADQVKDGLDGSGGITSSLADARHGIGLIPNGTAGDPLYSDFDGISSLTGGEALVRFTLLGDADLDGEVGGDDLLRARTNLGQPGNWLDGDFDYDGRVTARDWIMLRRNFGLSMPTGALAVAGESVPEPAAAGVLIIAGAMALRRRRPLRQN